MRAASAVARAVAAAAATALLGACAREAAEGRPWVRSIRIEGNHHLGAKTIRGRIALSRTSWIPFAPRRYFDPTTLEIDRRRVEALYAAHGFFLARVRSAEATPGPRGAVDVKIVVDEGPRALIESIEVSGLEAFPGEARRKLLARLPLGAGQPFVHGHYLEARDLLGSRLRAAGYAWADVSGSAAVDRARATVAIQLTVSLGPEARFGDVRVEGAGSVGARGIANRAAFRRGDRFDPALLEATRGRVYNLGLFSSVRVTYVANPARPDQADVVIAVHPATKNELRLGGGVGLERDRQELHLRVHYTRRNFLGGLRTLRLRLSPSYVTFPGLFSPKRQGPGVESEASLTQPDLLLRDLSLRGTVGYDLGIDYAFRYYGPRGSLGLVYPLARDWLLISVSYNVQRLSFFDTAPGILQDPTRARRFFGFTDPYRLAYLGEDLVLDLRDRPLAPRRGLYLSANFEQGLTLLGGSFGYQRVQSDLRLYLPLGPRVVVATRLLYGRIFTQGAGQASPITRRFYGGGPDSHRGFSYNRLAPQVPSGSALSPVPVGADREFLVQGELRLTLLRLGGGQLGAALFVDAGDVPDRPIDFRRLHVAVGGGLRYQTVIGTLRADLGFRLNRLSAFETDGRPNPDPGSRVAFHLSIGEAF